jgi:hypothetical protein
MKRRGSLLLVGIVMIAGCAAPAATGAPPSVDVTGF